MNIEEFRLPRYAQIPDVGLYLEQVVRYVNSHLAILGEPALTSSMVSNYVKQRLIPAPQKSCTPPSTLHACSLLPWSSLSFRLMGFG